MATSNSRDVELRIAATTSGEEQIRELSRQISTLAKEGGAAAPEYQKLAAELDKIAAQTATVDTLGKIETQLVDTGNQLNQAREKLDKLNKAFNEQRQTADDFKTAQTKAAAGVEVLQTQLRSAENALRTFRAAQDESSKGNDEAKAKLVELRTAVAGLKNELADQKALVATKSETREIEKSLRDAAKAYDAATGQVRALEGQLGSQRKAAADAGAALTSLGIASDDLGAAQQQVQQNLIDANRQIAAQQAYYRDLRAELERTAAQEKEWAELNAFEGKRQEAVKLQQASEYVRFWTESLAKAEAAEKDFAELQALEKKRQEAVKLQQAAEYVQFWTLALADAEAKERSLADVKAFEEKRQDALKLQQAAEYVNFWNKALAEAEQRERDIAELAAFEKKRQDAVKLLQAAEYVRFWTDSLEKAEAAEKRVADEAKSSAAALENAWAKTGVRSGQAIRAEIEQIVAALARLRSDSTITGDDFNRAFAAAEVQVKKLQNELNATPEALRRTGQGVNYVKDAFRQFAAVYGAFEIGKAFFDANVQIETLRRSLTLITGSSQGAARQIELLKEAANRSGVSVGAITDSFVKFQASLNGAKIPLETTEGLFRAVVNASGQLGLSSQKTSLILDALAQTANKGVVSMEELRQQLGDSLPGALDLTAKGLGISTAELVKLTENGKLLAADFLPALKKALVDTFGDGQKDIEGLGASFARLQNLATEFAQAIGDSGVGTGLIATFKGLGIVVGVVGLGINTVLETAFTLVRQLATGIAAIVSGDFKNLSSELERIAEESVTRQAKVVQSYRAFIGVTDEVSTAQTNVAAKLTAAGEAASGTAGNTDKLTASVAAAAKAAELAQPEWVKLTVEFQKATEALAAQVKLSTVYAEGVKIEGEARRQLAEIAGNEALKLQAAAESRAADADALKRTAGLRDAEVNLLKSERDQLEQLRARLGDVSGARQEAIDKLTKEIDLKTAEAKKATEAADATRLEALARQVTLKAYQDNSGALAQLADAYTAAKSAADAATAGERAGTVTKADLKVANERLAVSEALYRDAVSDTNRNVEVNNQLNQAKLGLTQGKLNLERASLESEIAVAKSLGNTAIVLENTIRLKEIDIKLIEAKNVALKAEAAATIAAANAERESLIVSGNMTAAKQAEIEARLLAAKTKLLEVDRNSVLIKGIEREIDLLRIRGLESNNTANGYVSDRNREVDSLEAVARAAERAAEAERKRRNVDKEGFSTGADGQRINALGNTYQSVFNSARSQGATDEQARFIANRFFPEGRGAPSGSAINESNSSGGFSNGGDLSTAILSEITKLTRAGLLGKTAEQLNSERRQQQPQQQQQQPQPAIGAAYTVNVNLGNNRTSIRTASQADAQALTNLLQTIGQAAGRSGP